MRIKDSLNQQWTVEMDRVCLRASERFEKGDQGAFVSRR